MLLGCIRNKVLVRTSSRCFRMAKRAGLNCQDHLSRRGMWTQCCYFQVQQPHHLCVCVCCKYLTIPLLLSLLLCAASTSPSLYYCGPNVLFPGEGPVPKMATKHQLENEDSFNAAMDSMFLVPLQSVSLLVTYLLLPSLFWPVPRPTSHHLLSMQIPLVVLVELRLVRRLLLIVCWAGNRF